MSLIIKEQVACPCGESFYADIVSSINAQADPYLKEVLIAGELNIVKCPACAEIFYVEHFLLYIDPPNELMAFVYPQSYSKDKQTWEKKMLDDFEKVQNELSAEEKIQYQPMLFFGLDTLLELIRYENEMQDEIEIVKYLAEKLSIQTIKLNPSEARKNHFPKLLPVDQKNQLENQREQVINGLKKILGICDELKIYKSAFQEILQNKSWNIEQYTITK